MVKNIVDTYLYYKKQFIILISGLKGTYKTAIAKKLSIDLNFDFIDTCDFVDKDKIKEITIKNNIVKDYNDAYNWEDIIHNINMKKNNGVVVSGEYFPPEHIKDIKFDLHIHIKLNKKNLLTKRLEYNKSHNTGYDEETENLIINKIVFPYYIKTIEESIINKFINANDIMDKKNNKEFVFAIYEKVFDEVIFHIVEYLKYKNLDEYIIYN